jgi:hypothetical protein
MTTPQAAKRKTLRRIRITGWTALTSLLVTIVGFLTWFHIVFPADRAATLEVYRDDRVVVTQDQGLVVMRPTGEANGEGVLYFPGARVSAHSYLYPFVDVAAAGHTVVIMDPLFNMALFDQRDLETLTGATPEITQWTLAGHSLGGVRACMLADHPDVTRLVLFASYCANDMSSTNIPVTLVLAERDGLLDREALDESRALLPPATTTLSVVGANHAAFGTYGVQPGDGVSTKDYPAMRSIVTEIMRSNSLPR